MSDLIRREDAIKAINKALDRETLLYGFVRKTAIDAIIQVPSADRPQEWIPCSEREPKGQGYYICTCKDGSKYKRASAVKWSNGWQLTGARAYWVVLAWMPLPQPWKGADDDI